MRLIDFLETKHDLAVKTAAFRDYQELISTFEKISHDPKMAGAVADFAGKAIKVLKSPFQKSPAQVVLHNANVNLFESLQALTSEMASHKKTMPEFQAWLGSDHGRSVVDAMGKIKGQVEKPVGQKWPFAGFAGVAAATAAAPAVSGMFQKHQLTSQHKDNLEQIAGDKAIPQNLRDRARDMYGILVRYAPTIALDPVFSKDFTKNLVRHDTVDHKIVADLIEAEKIYKESKGRKAEFLQAIGEQALSHSGWL